YRRHRQARSRNSCSATRSIRPTRYRPEWTRCAASPLGRSLPGGVRHFLLGCHLDLSALLQVGRRTEHDAFTAAQTIAEFDGGTKVAVDRHRLQVDALVLIDDRDPKSLLIEDQRFGRDDDVWMFPGNGKRP